MIAYRATLDVPREVVWFLAKLLAAERQRRGTPRGSRALTCFWQAVLGCGFRDRTAADALARDHGISRATAYRYLDEVVIVLAEQAPDLREALERAKDEGFSHLILDGKIIPCDRCKEPAVSVRGEVIDLWYSGKAHAHGGNVQAVLAPDGFPLWVSQAEPGSVHDIRDVLDRSAPLMEPDFLRFVAASPDDARAELDDFLGRFIARAHEDDFAGAMDVLAELQAQMPGVGEMFEEDARRIAQAHASPARTQPRKLPRAQRTGKTGPPSRWCPGQSATAPSLVSLVLAVGFVVGVLAQHRPEQMVIGALYGSPCAALHAAHVAVARRDFRADASAAAVTGRRRATTEPTRHLETDRRAPRHIRFSDDHAKDANTTGS